MCLYADLAPGGGLHRGRVAEPRVSSYLSPFQPYQRESRWRCISVALSLESPPPAVNRHPCPMVLGLSSYPQGARDRLVASQNVSYPFARQMPRCLPNGRNIVHRSGGVRRISPCHGPLLCPQCKHRMTGPLPARNVVPAVSGKIRHRAVRAPGTAPPARTKQGIAACPPGSCNPNFFTGGYFLCAYPICLRALVFHPGISSVRYPHQNGVSNHGLHDADADYHRTLGHSTPVRPSRKNTATGITSSRKEISMPRAMFPFCLMACISLRQ